MGKFNWRRAGAGAAKGLLDFIEQKRQDDKFNQREQRIAKQHEESMNYRRGRDAVGDKRWETTQEKDDTRWGTQQEWHKEATDYRKGRDTVSDKRYKNTEDYRKERDAIGDQRWNKQWDAQNAPYSAEKDPVLLRKEHEAKNYIPENDPAVKRQQFLNNQTASTDIKEAFKSLGKDGKYFFDDMMEFNETNVDTNYAAIPVGASGSARVWYKNKGFEQGTYILKKKDKYGFAKGQVKLFNGKPCKYLGGDKWDEL